MSPFLSAVIPAYNEAQNLRSCVQALEEQLGGVVSPDNGASPGLEILIVNDASLDDTGRLAETLAQEYPSVRAIHHPHNLGIGGAFCTGAAQACGEWVILIPADLALHPSELRRYLEAAPEADVVVGLRSDRSDYTLLRRVVSWVNIRLIQLLFGMRERQFQYISMYRRAVLDQIKIEYWRSAFFLAEVLIKAKQHGCRLVQVEIRYAPRLKGRPSGAKLWLIVKTVGDILHFWLRWIWLGPDRACGIHSPGDSKRV
jgi:glycosyltransferase involved in cell wall biosynthesis